MWCPKNPTGVACADNCKIRLGRGIISCFKGRNVVRRVCRCKAPKSLRSGAFLLFLFFTSFFLSVCPLYNFVLLFVCHHQLWSCSVLTSPAQRLRSKGTLGWIIYSANLFWFLSFDRSQAGSVWRRLGVQCCYLYSTPAPGRAARMCLVGWRAWDLRALWDVRHTWVLLSMAGKDFGMLA